MVGFPCDLGWSGLAGKSYGLGSETEHCHVEGAMSPQWRFNVSGHPRAYKGFKAVAVYQGSVKRERGERKSSFPLLILSTFTPSRNRRPERKRRR